MYLLCLKNKERLSNIANIFQHLLENVRKIQIFDFQHLNIFPESLENVKKFEYIFKQFLKNFSVLTFSEKVSVKYALSHISYTSQNRCEILL